MEDVDTGIHQGLEERLQLFRGLAQPGVVVLHLPLGETQHDGEVRPHPLADRPDNLDGETLAVGHAAAVLIIALVGAFPEELVDQVTVGAVDFNAVEANGLGIRGSIRKRLDDVLDVLLRHHMADHLTGAIHAGGAIARHTGIRLHAFLAHRTHMPQLREDLASGLVHRIHHLLPARQGLFAMEEGDILVAVGRRVVHRSAFRDQQSHTTLGTTLVVRHHVIGRHVAR